MRARAWFAGALIVWGAVACSWPGKTAMVLSNLKAPVRWRTHTAEPESKPLEPRTWKRLATLDHTREQYACGHTRRDDTAQGSRECVDGFLDFEGKDTLVAVAISGGGSRAARLAAHSLAGLEAEFDRIACDRDFIAAIDVFSTVSGGSLYAYHVARKISADLPLSPFGIVKPEAPLGIAELGQKDRKGVHELFRRLERSPRARLGTKHLGALSLQSVIGALGLNLVASPFLDWSYLDHLAKALEASESGNLWNPFLPMRLHPDLRMRDLPETPRFYFNATALETGHPFVLTQRITNGRHPPARDGRRAYPRRKRTDRRSARIDLHPPLADPEDDREGYDSLRPLRSGWTLEDFGASPAKFSVAYAAAASAAFPIGVEPLPLTKYQPDGEKMVPTEHQVRLSDGGIYDNSGLTAVVDLYEYLLSRGKVRHLVLIAINADITRYDVDRADRNSDERRWRDFFDPSLSPLPSLSSAAESLELMHFTNQRRGEAIAWARLQQLDRLAYLFGLAGEARHQKADEYEQLRENGLLFVHYFPISLLQLTHHDPEQIDPEHDPFGGVKDVPTGYWLTSDDDEEIKEASHRILTTRQCRGWKVGPEREGKASTVECLDEAVAFAVLRAGNGRWEEALDAEKFRTWCAEKTPSCGARTPSKPSGECVSGTVAPDARAPCNED